MGQFIKNKLKEQKGLTLIELLAVIVILGIIAAIAVPSILGLIDNSKKDAHVANATQMISSTKLAVAGDDTLRPADAATPKFIPLKYLEDKGYIETMKDPDGGNYTANGDPAAVVTASTGLKSYVQVTSDTSGKVFTYSVFLDGSKKDIGTLASPVAEASVKRSAVIVTP